jgi:hypothetical protein
MRKAPASQITRRHIVNREGELCSAETYKSLNQFTLSCPVTAVSVCIAVFTGLTPKELKNEITELRGRASAGLTGKKGTANISRKRNQRLY